MEKKKKLINFFLFNRGLKRDLMTRKRINNLFFI